MKKSISLVGCLLFFMLGNLPAMADGNNPPQQNNSSQSNMVPSSLLGLELGINLADLNGANVKDVIGSRLGFVGGAFLNFHLLPNLGIQPEVLYEQKGGKSNGTAYQLDYVEIPVLVDITLMGPLSVLIGPSFDSTAATQGTTAINTTDTGLVLGAQLNISNFLLSGRYEMGLTDVLAGVNSNQNFQNGTFTFMAGLSLI